MKASCGFPYKGCKCLERMGNDFWFLPADRCLYEDGKNDNPDPNSSEKRGGSDYAPSASGKPGYNPMVGGKRMFGRQPTPAEAAANSANVKAFSSFVQGLQPIRGGAKHDG